MSRDTCAFFHSLQYAASIGHGAESSTTRTVAAANVPLLNRFAPDMKFQVLGSIAEDGAKLVEISSRDLADLRWRSRACGSFRFSTTN